MISCGKVLVRYKASISDINIINNLGNFVIAKMYSSHTDPDFVYSYMKFDQIFADNEEVLIDKYYKNHDYYDRNSAGFIIGKVDESNSDSSHKFLLLKVDVELTNTEGLNAYVVCLACGGEMGAPEYRYGEFQLIRADDEQEAVETYNRINNCTYYYGKCLGEVVTQTITVTEMLKEWIEELKDSANNEEYYSIRCTGMRCNTIFYDESTFSETDCEEDENNACDNRI